MDFPAHPFFYFMLGDNKKFSGADWGAYNAFEFKWLEIVLTKHVITRKELLHLLQKFGITFSKKNWEIHTSDAEMGNALINDIPKDKLFSVVKTLIQEHKDVLTFEEAYELYQSLLPLGIESLTKFYIDIAQNTGLKEIVIKLLNTEKTLNEFSKKDILFFILGELYIITKANARQKVNSFLDSYYEKTA